MPASIPATLIWSDEYGPYTNIVETALHEHGYKPWQEYTTAAYAAGTDKGQQVRTQVIQGFKPSLTILFDHVADQIGMPVVGAPRSGGGSQYLCGVGQATIPAGVLVIARYTCKGLALQREIEALEREIL